MKEQVEFLVLCKYFFCITFSFRNMFTFQILLQWGQPHRKEVRNSAHFYKIQEASIWCSRICICRNSKLASLMVNFCAQMFWQGYSILEARTVVNPEYLEALMDVEKYCRNLYGTRNSLGFFLSSISDLRAKQLFVISILDKTLFSHCWKVIF